MRKTSKIYTDHRGNQIPAAYLHKTDREKHAKAQKYYKQALKLSERLNAFKTDLLQECDKLHNQLLDENLITQRSNSRGGYSISTIDKEIKIEVSVSERIHFDERIEMAQEKINEYLNELTAGVNGELTQLINHAFTTSKGSLDTKRIMGLFRLTINHPKWQQALELIKQSIQSDYSKRYVRIWKRNNNGQYEAVKLDFASL